jgi:chitodextrinase
MKIAQPISNQPTRLTLTASRDFILKLKGAEIYFPSAFVTDALTVEQAAELFDEVSILDVPKYNGALKQQQAVLAAALGVDAAQELHEEPSDAAPAWEAGEFIRAGQVRTFGGVLQGPDEYYRCVQGHVTQPGWEPPAVPALWVKVAAPSATGAPAAWVQPTGAHDAYAKGARVTHNGKTWESTVNANVYAPGVVAGQWTEIN